MKTNSVVICKLFDTYYNSHLTLQLNTLNIYHWIFCPSVDCWFSDIYVLQGSVAT